MSNRTKGSSDPNSPKFVVAFVVVLLIAGGLFIWATSPKSQPLEKASATVMKPMPVDGVTPIDPKFKTPKIGKNSFIPRGKSTELKSLNAKIFATYYYEDNKPLVKVEWNGMMFSLDEEFSQIGDWNIRLAGSNEQGAILESDPLPY